MLRETAPTAPRKAGRDHHKRRSRNWSRNRLAPSRVMLMLCIRLSTANVTRNRQWRTFVMTPSLPTRSWVLLIGGHFVTPKYLTGIIPALLEISLTASPSIASTKSSVLTRKTAKLVKGFGHVPIYVSQTPGSLSAAFNLNL